MAKQKLTFKITIIENGRISTYECANEKEKNKWLYEYFTRQERPWAWEQWGNSNHKTFDKWFKEFVKPKWKESHLQSFRINKKLILIKKQEKK